MRGYFGIGIQGAKTKENVGGLWRTAHAFGAAFIFTVGHRYPVQPSDTTKASRHVPLFEHTDIEAFLDARPRDCELVAVECGQGKPRPLPEFTHHERAIYVLGAEDHGMDPRMLAACDRQLEIPLEMCLNVAVTGAVVLYDRMAKAAA
jgi:tRNA G18 (ribose-2'-O)-methylase SpoU